MLGYARFSRDILITSFGGRANPSYGLRAEPGADQLNRQHNQFVLFIHPISSTVRKNLTFSLARLAALLKTLLARRKLG